MKTVVVIITGILLELAESDMERIEEALLGVDGVEVVITSYVDISADVICATSVTVDGLKAALRAIGFDARVAH